MKLFSSEPLKLKPGDSVYVLKQAAYNYYQNDIYKVEKITKTGRIKLRGYSRYFDKFGYEIGTPKWEPFCFICPVPDDG